MNVNQLVEKIKHMKEMSQTDRIQLGNEILELSFEEFERLGRVVLEKGLEETSLSTLNHLITIRPQDATPIQWECIQQGVYNIPSSIYRYAKPEITEAILLKIEQAIAKKDFQTVSELLEAWVSIGDESVQKKIASWIEAPPNWEENLPITLEEYMYYGGWRWDRQKGKMNLIFFEDSFTTHQINPQILQNEICHDCGKPLVVLFDLDLQNPELQFIGISGDRLRIATCAECTSDQTLYFHVDGEGRVRWYEGNPIYLGVTQHELNFDLEDGNETPCYQVDRKLERWEDFALEETKIGGTPYWIQTPVFPKCPSCNEEMPLLAQYQTKDEEGMIYINLCALCGMIATERMQT